MNNSLDIFFFFFFNTEAIVRYSGLNFESTRLLGNWSTAGLLTANGQAKNLCEGGEKVILRKRKIVEQIDVFQKWCE